jgi:hypothetical protein
MGRERGLRRVLSKIEEKRPGPKDEVEDHPQYEESPAKESPHLTNLPGSRRVQHRPDMASTDRSVGERCEERRGT